jgi:hypothetical protein
MNTLNSKSGFQRALCATLSSVVTVVAIAVSTLASRPYVLPGHVPYSTSATIVYAVELA